MIKQLGGMMERKTYSCVICNQALREIKVDQFTCGSKRCLLRFKSFKRAIHKMIKAKVYKYKDVIKYRSKKKNGLRK